MNKKNYYKLCYELNKIFKRVSNNTELLPCLQSITIIKENKQYYNQSYKILNGNFILLKTLKSFFKNIFFFFIFVFIALFLKVFLLKKKKLNKIDFIFLSHGFKEINFKDNYFNYFKIYLKEKKRRFKTYFINQNSKVGLSKNNKLLSILNISIIQIFKIIYKIFYNFIFTLKLYFREKNINDKKTILYLLSNIISTSSLKNYLITYEILNLLKTSEAKYFFFTFEGFVYEKYLMATINKSKILKTKTFGYQHTGLSKHVNSLINLNNKLFLPYKILCISKNDKNILKKKLKFKNIISVGKKITEFNKSEKIKNWKIINYNKSKAFNCLILFENNYNEINILLKDYFKYKKKINFTIRSHPLFEKKINNIKKLNQLKISKSNTSLSKAISKNEIVLYKSSGIVYDCLRQGLFPLRIKDFEYDENPLSKIIFFNEVSKTKDIINIKKIVKKNNYITSYKNSKKNSEQFDLNFIKNLK